jgi:hypothetical protein
MRKNLIIKVIGNDTIEVMLEKADMEVSLK